MSKVFLLDHHKQPLDPIHPGYARRLLNQGKAAIFRQKPFTLILKEVVVDEPKVELLRVKIDPGSKTTGLAIVNDETGEVVFAAELAHRGHLITLNLTKRKHVRRSRRSRNTRFRPARFLNRGRYRKGLIPPSLESRLSNVMTWVNKLRRYCPIGFISLESVKFDMQLMQNPEISGVEYQHGELSGYECREYLMEKWQYKCAYCKKSGIPLQKEHIIPRSRGGSNRVSNLTLACEKCNKKKGAKTAIEFGFPHVQAHAKAPLKDAAAVNTIRNELLRRLKDLWLEVETGSGGLTKYNRVKRGLAKTHWLDAACVGKSTPVTLLTDKVNPLLISAKGWGIRRMCMTDKYGFPAKHRTRNKSFMGFQTGDLVKAVIPLGHNAGTHVGRITIRQKPKFQLGKFTVHPRYLTILQRVDGYDYSFEPKCKVPKVEATPTSSSQSVFEIFETVEPRVVTKIRNKLTVASV